MAKGTCLPSHRPHMGALHFGTPPGAGTGSGHMLCIECGLAHLPLDTWRHLPTGTQGAATPNPTAGNKSPDASLQVRKTAGCLYVQKTDQRI